MMNAYTMPVITAVIFFPILAGLAVLPYVVIQYRKFGSVSKLKTLVLFSFGFYLLCAYFLVILPLPAIEKVAQMTSGWTIFQPLQVISLLRAESVFRLLDPSTYLPALKQHVFLQPFFNLMLTLPFGVYLRYLTRMNWKQALLAGLGLSLFFELTQLSGLYFIYPRPYRVFEVDDLILNTLGTGLGFALEPFILRLLPSFSQLNANAVAESGEVSFVRRFSAYAIDWTILNALFIILSFLWPTLTLDTYAHYLLAVAIYFVLLPLLWKGATPGKHLVKIRLVKLDGSTAPLGSLLLRQVLLYGLMVANTRFYIPGLLAMSGKLDDNQLIMLLGALLVLLVIQLFYLVDALLLLLGKNHRLFYERASGLVEVEG